jgi:benzoyl-CoA reductase/2-hydroxyglutaryl-CoA dehydratase subunit BcrC/BadD/HgdB
LCEVGFTTSIPVEILYAAGRRPVDLNNAFISRPDVSLLVRQAETAGFPSTCCAWIKGIYGVLNTVRVREVIGVVRGDCSQTQGLLEVLQMEGVRVYPFSYPYDRSRRAMEQEIGKMSAHFGAEPGRVVETKRSLDRVRGKLKRLDTLTWRENRVSGQENHSFLLASTDMKGDPFRFEREVDRFLDEVDERDSLERTGGIRLGVLGVPPIWADLYAKLERPGVRVVYNEVQRQFSMPVFGEDLADQYLSFTYPYDVFFRLQDIQREAVRRRLDGFVHYVQSFCFRQIEDKILRKLLSLPVLTLEGDRPESVDLRIEVRVEAFLEMLSREKKPGRKPA